MEKKKNVYERGTSYRRNFLNYYHGVFNSGIYHCSYCGRLIKSDNMTYIFLYCGFLTTAPTIPNSVTNMSSTFYSCTSLTGTITINANPTNYNSCFENTTKSITLTGSSTKLSVLAATATNSNVTVR